MNDLSNIDDKDLVAELARRKKVKRAKAWPKLESLRVQVFCVLLDHDLAGMKWSSTTDTLEDETEEFFESLWGACGGNDIEALLK